MKAHNVRIANQRLIIDHLQRVPRSSKASIADACALSKPTAGKIIDELIEADVVQNVMDTSEEHGLGRPGQMLQLNQTTPRFLLIELSARQTVFRLVSVAGNSIVDETCAAPTNASAFVALCSAWHNKHAQMHVWACALSVPGVVDEANRRVLKSPNLPWTEDPSWFAALETVFNCTIAMVQEIRALALAHVHADQSPSSFLYVYNGEGLGGALVIDEQLFKGASSLSVEIGHTPVVDNDRQCGCGNSGCLETLLAEPALLTTYASGDWLSCKEQMRTQPHLIRDAVLVLGRHVAAAANISGAHNIVLAGNINDWPRGLQQELEKTISKYSMCSQFGTLCIDYSLSTFQRGLVAYLCDYVLANTSNWEKPCQLVA